MSKVDSLLYKHQQMLTACLQFLFHFTFLVFAWFYFRLTNKIYKAAFFCVLMYFIAAIT